jgi:hypothetical protein
MYRKYFFDDEEILWKNRTYKNYLKLFFKFFILTIIFSFISVPLFLFLFNDIFNFKEIIGGEIYILINVFLILIINIAYIIDFFYSYLQKFNLSWKEIENYKSINMITNYHIIKKDFLQIKQIISKRDLKKFIGHEIKRVNDCIIIDLDLFNEVIINQEKKKIIFQPKQFKALREIYFSFNEGEKTEFDGAYKTLKDLMEKRKDQREKRREKEDNRKYIPLIGDIMDYLERSPFDFYSWGRIALGIIIFLILSTFISTPVYNYWSSSGRLITGCQFITFLFTFFIHSGIGILEAVIFQYSGFAYKSEKFNSTSIIISDISFGIIGGIIMWITQVVIMSVLKMGALWFYLSGALLFIIILSFYFIGYFITNENTKNR